MHRSPDFQTMPSEQDCRKMMKVVSFFKQRDIRDELVPQNPDDELASVLLEQILEKSATLD